MALFKDDQNRLDALEHSPNPMIRSLQLASTCLPSAASRPPDQYNSSGGGGIMLAWYEFWVGLIVLFTGSAVAHGLISTGTVISCYGASLLVCAAVTAFQNHPDLRRRRQ
jgi:hypothetical protein